MFGPSAGATPRADEEKPGGAVQRAGGEEAGVRRGEGQLGGSAENPRAAETGCLQVSNMHAYTFHEWSRYIQLDGTLHLLYKSEGKIYHLWVLPCLKWVTSVEVKGGCFTWTPPFTHEPIPPSSLTILLTADHGVTSAFFLANSN